MDRDALAGQKDADQVQGIGGADGDQLAAGRFLAHRAQFSNGLRQRELLAGDTVNEAPAADFTAGLEPPANPQQVAPRHPRGLAVQQRFHQHAVTAEQGPGQVFQGLDARLV